MDMKRTRTEKIHAYVKRPGQRKYKDMKKTRTEKIQGYEKDKDRENTWI